MNCKWVNSKEILEEDDWTYPPITPTAQQRKQIIGHVAEIGTRMIFENFCYQFGGKAFHQQEGGPIGARVTTDHVCCKNGNAALGKRVH